MPMSAGMNDIQQCPNATGEKKSLLVLVKPVKRDITCSKSIYISRVSAARLLVFVHDV